MQSRHPFRHPCQQPALLPNQLPTKTQIVILTIICNNSNISNNDNITITNRNINNKLYIDIANNNHNRLESCRSPSRLPTHTIARLATHGSQLVS